MFFIKKWGLALAGGGTRGAYHLGVYKALIELDIQVSAVVGTSIGSVNGALFAQNDYEKCLEIWENITILDVIKFDKELIEEKNLLDYKNLVPVITEMIEKNGLETMPFHNFLTEVIDEEKIRSSDIEYGLNTTSVSDIESVGVFVDDIPKGRLVEYIMASSCFPGFQKVLIDNKVYADGGIMNNLPIDMLIKRGYKNIIAVDVGGVGFVKKENTFDVNIITIKCKKPLLSIFEFDKTLIQKSIKQGYLDTYKALGRLVGENYYFNVLDYQKARKELSSDILLGVEFAAEIYGIDNIAIYKIDDLIDGVIKKFLYYQEKYKNRGTLNKEPDFLLTRLAELILKNKADAFNNKIFASAFSKKLLAAKTIVYFLNNK